MLQEMRKYAKSSVASVFLGLLALSFGVWGIADIFHGSADTTVAAVGDAKIPQETYQREYQNYIRNTGEETGKQITPEQARAQGLPDQILQQLDQPPGGGQCGGAAEAHGQRQLRRPSGQIHPRLRRAARHLRPRHRSCTPSSNWASPSRASSHAVRDDTARSQLLDATKNGLEMPAGYAQALFDYLNEERAVQYVEMPAASVTVATPTDAQLAAYVKAHARHVQHARIPRAHLSSP